MINYHQLVFVLIFQINPVPAENKQDKLGTSVTLPM